MEVVFQHSRVFAEQELLFFWFDRLEHKPLVICKEKETTRLAGACLKVSNRLAVVKRGKGVKDFLVRDVKRLADALENLGCTLRYLNVK